jgi:hypothetical protein
MAPDNAKNLVGQACEIPMNEYRHWAVPCPLKPNWQDVYQFGAGEIDANGRPQSRCGEGDGSPRFADV